MGRLFLAALAVLGIILAAPLLVRQGGLGGAAGLLVVLWAALMVYLIGLIWVRLKRGMGASEQRMHDQLAQFLAETNENGPPEKSDGEAAPRISDD